MAQQTYRLTISYNTAGQFAQNVLHYEFDDALYADTTLAANALNNAFNTHCTGALKDALNINTKILSYKSRRITAVGGFEAIRLGTITDVGNRAGDLSASGLAPLIRFITNDVPVRTGRMFLPGVSDNDSTDGYLTAAFFTDLTDLANVLDDSLTLVGGGAPTATAVIWSTAPVKVAIPISIAVPSPYLATQRRRQRPA
jgi:hypothetical protein